MSDEEPACRDCGGRTKPFKGPGRVRLMGKMMGAAEVETYAVPDGVESQRCSACGADWFTASQLYTMLYEHLAGMTR